MSNWFNPYGDNKMRWGLVKPKRWTRMQWMQAYLTPTGAEIVKQNDWKMGLKYRQSRIWNGLIRPRHYWSTNLVHNMW